VEVTSRRGKVVEPVRIGNIIPGHVFIPFHYGYWDKPGRSRAANELTITEWDPVSKQPHFKYAAVNLQKAGESNTQKHESISGKISGAIESVKEKLKPEEA
jgi:ferredoxin-nitrate reductase